MVKRNVSVQATPEKTGFLISDAALAVLARDYSSSLERAGRVRGTYLSVLVAHSKRELKAVAARATSEQAVEAVEKVHEHFYAIVLDAVVTPDIAVSDDMGEAEKLTRSKERTRRATFARTAKSTLVSAIKGGARLSSLDPAKITKAGLQKYFAAAREGPVTAEERTERTQGRLGELVQKLAEDDLVATAQLVEGQLEGLVKQMAEEDLAAAMQLVEGLQERLESVLEQSRPAPRRMRGGKRQVGELVLHPH